MTVNTRLVAPNYKIFEPDALDVALSNKVLDPLQGGIAGAMLLTHNRESALAQQDYTGQLDRFNSMARGLDAMEMEHKTKQEGMKLAPGLMEHGTSAKDIIGIENILNPSGIQADDAATAFKAWNDARIAEARAKAANAGAGHDVKEQTTENQVDAAGNVTVAHRYGGPPRVAPNPNPAANVVPPAGSAPAPVVQSTPIAPPTGQGAVNADAAARISAAKSLMAATGHTDYGQAAKSVTRNNDGTITMVGPKGTKTIDSTGKIIR